MLQIRLICVGKLKEKFYIDASKEYINRLTGYCKIEMEEVSEVRLSDRPSEAEITAALKAEAGAIGARLIKGCAVIALCVEGTQLDSEANAAQMAKYASEGVSRLCFIIGGSYGLHPSIKERADLRLSISRMTFPHHLVRIMLLEQIYRGFKITEGGKYHK